MMIIDFYVRCIINFYTTYPKEKIQKYSIYDDNRLIHDA